MVLDDSLKRWSFPKKTFLDHTAIRKGTHHNRDTIQPTPLSDVSVSYDSEFRNQFGGESGIPSGRRSFRGMLGSS